jgi:histidinol-phosphate/aromatic aminotransferase/cobyric acid decarboxylase-like protein
MSKINSINISSREKIKSDIVKPNTIYNCSPCGDIKPTNLSLPFYNITPNTVIDATLGEPYMICESIAPNSNCFSSDKPDAPSGLNYLSTFTNQRNINVIKDLYKNLYGITIPSTATIITGCGGSTLLYGAYFYAVQRKLGKDIIVSSPRKVTYGGPKNISNILKNTQWIDQYNQADVYAIVSPNNPDGYIYNDSDFTNFNKNPNAYLLIDSIYDARHFTNQTTLNSWCWNYLSDSSNSMFNKIAILSSFSKLGIAGLRYGYIIVNDAEIVQDINNYIWCTTLVPPSSGAQCAYNNYISYWNKLQWNHNIYTKFQTRFQQFKNVIKKHGIILFNVTSYAPYLYTDKSPAWWLTNFNIKTRSGTEFSDTAEHSRISLMVYDHQWDAIIKRLSQRIQRYPQTQSYKFNGVQSSMER